MYTCLTTQIVTTVVYFEMVTNTCLNVGVFGLIGNCQNRYVQMKSLHSVTAV